MIPDDTGRRMRYAELLREYNSNIAGFCASRCGTRAEADELMQEVFVALWEGMGSLRDGCPPAMVNRWMYRVMRTAWSRHRRHRGNLVVLPPEKLPAPPAPHNEIAETVEELLAALDPDTSHLMHRHLEGYSVAELASEYSLKKETVKKRITRAIEKMRQTYLMNHGERQQKR